MASDCSSGTSPSYGQPQTVETYARTRRPASMAGGIDLGERIERLLDALVRVLAVVRLRGRQEHGDLTEPADAERPLEARRVRHERAPGDALGRGRYGRDELFGVGELRHPARRNEARELDAPEPAAEQRGDQLASCRRAGSGAASFCRPSRGETS